THGVGAVKADRADDHFERCDRSRPQDALVVVALLDCRPENARYADAVAAPFHDLVAAVFVEERALQRSGVFCAQLENVPDLNASADFKRAFALGRWIARDHVAQIRDFRLVEIAADIGSGEVPVVFVRADDEVAHRSDRTIHYYATLEAYGPERPRRSVECALNGLGAGEGEWVGDAGEFLPFEDRK